MSIAPLILAFCAGIALQCRLSPALIWLGLASLALYATTHLRVGFSALLIMLLATGGGYGYTSLWRSRQAVTVQERKVEFSGTIVEPPDIRSQAIFLTVASHEAIGTDPRGRPVSGRVLIHADRYPTWQYGDRLNVRGVLSKPEAINGFNYPLYLERYGVYGIIQRPTWLGKIGSGSGNRQLALLYGFGRSLEHSIQQTLPEPESSFLAGVLLGSKRAIPSYIQDQLRQTGTSHIIAISGANITILLDLLLRLLPVSSTRAKLLATVSIALFISLLTGASASVVRGATVACLGVYLRFRSRRAWTAPLITGCMLVMLLSNPLLLVADPGFQLSFAAFAGLSYFGSPLSAFLERAVFVRRLPEVIRASLAETTAATLGTAPISLLLFRQLSLLGLIVNPLILWLLPSATFLGLLSLPLARLPPLRLLVGLPLWLILHSILATIASFSRLRFGVIRLEEVP